MWVYVVPRPPNLRRDSPPPASDRRPSPALVSTPPATATSRCRREVRIPSPAPGFVLDPWERTKPATAYSPQGGAGLLPNASVGSRTTPWQVLPPGRRILLSCLSPGSSSFPRASGPRAVHPPNPASHHCVKRRISTVDLAVDLILRLESWHFEDRGCILNVTTKGTSSEVRRDSFNQSSPWRTGVSWRRPS
jgi:hypothetical protein